MLFSRIFLSPATQFIRKLDWKSLENLGPRGVGASKRFLVNALRKKSFYASSLEVEIAARVLLTFSDINSFHFFGEMLRSPNRYVRSVAKVLIESKWLPPTKEDEAFLLVAADRWSTNSDDLAKIKSLGIFALPAIELAMVDDGPSAWPLTVAVGRPAIPMLLGLLNRPHNRQWAIKALGEIGCDSVLPKLVEALSQIGRKPDDFDQKALLVAILKLGGMSFLFTVIDANLERLLHHSLIYAAQKLADMDTKATIPLLQRVLQMPDKQSTSDWYDTSSHYIAKRALKKLGRRGVRGAC